MNLTELSTCRLSFTLDWGHVGAFCSLCATNSLLAFELLRPHVDYLDIQLYRTVR